MEFYLTGKNTKLHLPMNPEQLQVMTSSKLFSVSIIELGDFLMPRGIAPATIRWEGIFPGVSRRNSIYVVDWQDPKAIVGLISGWRRENVKVHLLITETPINMDCYIQEFDHTWKGGHGDCYYSISLVEARNLVVMTEKEKSTSAQAKTSAQRPAPSIPKTYTVKQGDTLWGIAKKMLGDGAKWKTLYELNKAVIGPDPNKIKPGQVLKLG